MLNYNTLKTQKRRIMQPLFNAFDKVIEPYISNGLILAISGGPDSKILLESISDWPKRNNGKIIVICCDHQTRKESYLEAKAVISRAKILGFSSEIIKLKKTDKKDEATLRNLRYNALWLKAKKNNITSICTAHHADDSSEGYLMNLLGIGGGILGSSLPEKVNMDNGKILRPFAYIRKDDLLLALSSLNFIDYFQDPLDMKQISNRSKVRYNLFPILKSYNNLINKRFFNLARNAALDEETLNKICEKKISLIKCIKSDEISIEFKNETRSIKKRILKKILKLLIKKNDLRNAENGIEKVLDSLDQGLNSSKIKQCKKLSFDLPYVKVIIDKNKILIKRK